MRLVHEYGRFGQHPVGVGDVLRVEHDGAAIKVPYELLVAILVCYFGPALMPLERDALPDATRLEAADTVPILRLPRGHEGRVRPR